MKTKTHVQSRSLDQVLNPLASAVSSALAPRHQAPLNPGGEYLLPFEAAAKAIFVKANGLAAYNRASGWPSP